VQPHFQFDGRTGSVLARRQDRVDLWSLSAECPPVLTGRIGLRSLAGEIRSCAASSNEKIITAGASATMARVFPLDHTDEDVGLVVSGHDMSLPPAPVKQVLESRIGKIRSLGTKFAELLSGIAGSQDKAMLGRRRSLCVVAIAADSRSLFVGCDLPFDVEHSSLVVAWSTNSLILLDLSNGGVTKLHVPEWVKQPTTCVSASSDSKPALFSGGHLWFISSFGNGLQDENCSVSKKDKSAGKHHDLGWHDSLLGTCILDRQRMALMHRPWSLVASTLPDTVPRKVYGT
jgi:hypothetical protein